MVEMSNIKNGDFIFFGKGNISRYVREITVKNVFEKMSQRNDKIYIIEFNGGDDSEYVYDNEGCLVAYPNTSTATTSAFQLDKITGIGLCNSKEGLEKMIKYLNYLDDIINQHTGLLNDIRETREMLQKDIVFWKE